jgi:hypothetical protein
LQDENAEEQVLVAFSSLGDDVLVEEFDVFGQRVVFRKRDDVDVFDERREFFRGLNDSDTILVKVVVEDVRVFREASVAGRLVREEV